MKKSLLFSMLVMIMLISSIQAVAFAETNDIVVEEIEIPLIIERVDVPYAEAVKDSTFSTERNLQRKTINSRADNEGYWDVYGKVEMLSTQDCRAMGRSALYTDNSDNRVLIETEHYTRTFFGTASSPYGDSGRVWGETIVYAYGKTVPWSNVTYKTQRVFYGTEA